MIKSYTAKDKVIVHLLDYYDKQDRYPQPPEVTQEGISESIESKQNTVSYAVRNLVKDGILNEKTTRVEGKKQRRKGYFLTDKGVEKARKKKDEMANTRITLVSDGKEKEVLVKDVNKYIHMNLSIVEILNNLENGKLEYTSSKKERDKVSYLVDYAKPPGFEPGYKEELKGWLENSKSSMLLLKGDFGIGKTSLITNVLEEQKGVTNLFYFKLRSWHTPRRLLNGLAEFLSKTGQHKLSSYLESSTKVDLQEALTNFEKDMRSLVSVLMVVEDISGNGNTLDLIAQLSKSIEKHPSSKLIISQTPGQFLEEYIEISTDEIKLEPKKGMDYYGRLSEYFEIADTDTQYDILESVLSTRLTSEELLALSYISVYRESVEKSEVTELEHVNEYTLKNLLQTPLLEVSVEGRLLIPRNLKDRLLETMSYNDRKFLHERALEYYGGIPARNSTESIEFIYHSVKVGDFEKLVKELEEKGEMILSSGYSRCLLQVLDEVDIEDIFEEDRAIIDYFAGECYRIEEDYENSVERFENLLDLASDKRMKAKAHEGLGDINARYGDYNEALEDYKKAEYLFEEVDGRTESLIGRIYFKMAQLSNEQGDYDEAKRYLERSITMLEHKGRYSLLTSSYFLLARVEKSRGNWETALDYFKKGVDSWKKINESYQRVGRLHDIGSFYKVIRELSNAEKFLKETIETCEKFGYRHLKAQALLTLSECHLEKGEYEDAIEIAEKAKDIFDSLGKEEEQGYVHALFGQIYLKMDMDDKAETHLGKAISIYQKLGSSYSLGLAYFSMAKLQERKGNRKGIADNYRKALLSITSSGADEMAQKIKREMKTIPLSM
ncbi:MAG: tetratricopeptide repeat protein [Candidatus Saliniplasma sp.]